MQPDRFRAVRVAVGLCIGAGAGWTLFDARPGSSVGFLAILGLIFATKADRYRLDGTDASLFFAGLFAAGAVAAVAGAGAISSLIAGLAMAIAGLWFRRWLQPTRTDLSYATPTRARRGAADRARLIRASVSVQPKRLLKLLAVGVGALTFIFGALWSVLIATLARETGSIGVEHWLAPLGVTTLGATAGSWGVWMLRQTPRRSKSKAKKKRRAKGLGP